jgi:hypothetical protein
MVYGTAVAYEQGGYETSPARIKCWTWSRGGIDARDSQTSEGLRKRKNDHPDFDANGLTWAERRLALT